VIWSTATCDGNWNVAGMRAVLPAGVFYRHQFGSQFPPNPAIVALFPGLEFTTHIRAAFDPFGSTTILGGWPQSAIVNPDSTIRLEVIPEPAVAAIAALATLLLRRAGG
jgi:hypothetical protein